jgi:DNA invertase Pin-like site-specific DNA recombinase
MTSPPRATTSPTAKLIQPSPLRTSTACLLRSAKLQDQHRAKLAIVYVRQSSPHQVLEHRESRELQYALADHAVALGWPKERVLVIDEDQGQSGKTAEDRAGFQRLVAEVTMSHVGLILGLEVSRLARSNKDWHQLFELCAFFQTLLADQEGVYDASDPNDRLILGLKGMMSEVELITMRNRLERGKLHKAERGELFAAAPLGYIRLPSGGIAFDPDEQVQSVVRLIFAKYEELGSVYGVFRYLLRERICVGMRPHRGPKKGHVEWRRPALPTLFAMLHNPTYAGAYAFGRQLQDPRLRATGKSKTGVRSVPMEQWKVLIRDHVPAYIPWERFLENQTRMRQNRLSTASAGVPRSGAALLSGLLVCGTCGARMHVTYQRRGTAYYNCVRHLARGTERTCHGLQARGVDELVASQVLQALTPAALEVSAKAVAERQQEHARLEQHWRQRLERARYEAERAQRQYHAVEPENRLVARTLEKAWEEALQAEATLQEEHDRFIRTGPQPLSATERAKIRALAEDIPALWHAPPTTVADRKEIVRSLVERVVARVRHNSECTAVTIHWQGGCKTEHEVLRAVSRFEYVEGFDGLLKRIVELRGKGQTAAQIAEILNREGYRTPKKRGDYTEDSVRRLVSKRGLIERGGRSEPLGRHEWRLAGLARKLRIARWKLRSWASQGWLHGRQTMPDGSWIVWADPDEIERLKQLRARSQRGVRAHPKKLITPKKRPTK